MSTPKMSFHVEARRVDAHGSLARCKNAEITLETDLAGNLDALNPAELLLAALSACMIKGIERAEHRYLNEVVEKHATRTAWLPWQAEEPTGPAALARLAAATIKPGSV